ncbi:helix-turn-helix domain-containing protein [Subtercola boreus]|uniref:Helix-turn-helix domain-containing protein n=1 Tax=Subtercola boreus TaxID=120213 RepID=A0A3E0W9C1_9MICO|nr:helix-turn-helix domain-containing protein [Subtercola boreus]RFA18108.1 hypothetical protein B7R24_15795 [Subtercola boreus]RFA18490.1 hypothetical protein B7R23_15830 [Subtercola boreus]RFA25018.1 hypothetical protein B7R25_15825 [Subtercola boreus]
MSTTMSNGTLILDDEVRADARELASKTQLRAVAGLTITLDDGAVIALPAHLAEFVGRILNALSHGPLTVSAIPRELTSTSAAGILAVSRPTLMKWVSEGALRSHRVGSHHRFDTSEVMALAQARRASREQAFAALRAMEESLNE